MRKKIVILLLALALAAGAQMGLFAPNTVEADTCESFCSEEFEGCICCSRCCEAPPPVYMICTPGACICP